MTAAAGTGGGRAMMDAAAVGAAAGVEGAVDMEGRAVMFEDIERPKGKGTAPEEQKGDEGDEEEEGEPEAVVAATVSVGVFESRGVRFHAVGARSRARVACVGLEY